MDVIDRLSRTAASRLTCIDMHTCGEPTRIIISGYPELTGTLLEQRAQAKAQHDHIRKMAMLEPRGHFDMYGALLRPHTELTNADQADIGVLFMTNDGYSTMCGHATIALGRFLIDTHDLQIFPRRHNLRYDSAKSEYHICLHTPCGLVAVTVPTDSTERISDPTRPVTFVSVPSFATGLNVEIPLSPQDGWPQLDHRTAVKADFSYGGAFYCLVSAKELGFDESLNNINLGDLSLATKRLKNAVNNNESLRYLFQHPDEQDLSFLYSVIVTKSATGRGPDESETGICFFSDQQLDRSPTGSGVSARLAAAYANGVAHLGDSKIYHSLLTRSSDPPIGFKGTVLNEVAGLNTPYPAITTRIEGHAYYTGSSNFVVESSDTLGATGFVMSSFANSQSN